MNYSCVLPDAAYQSNPRPGTMPPEKTQKDKHILWGFIELLHIMTGTWAWKRLSVTVGFMQRSQHAAPQCHLQTVCLRN